MRNGYAEVYTRVAPLAGAWIETILIRMPPFGSASRPSRARGSKLLALWFSDHSD